MKKLILLLCLIFLLSCEKYSFLPDSYSKSIFGDWKWTWTACWFGGAYIWADSVDYTQQITFDQKGYFYKYQDDSLILSSKYRLDLPEDRNGYKTYRLTLDKTNEEYQALLIADTLTLMVYDIMDACEVFYLKLK